LALSVVDGLGTCPPGKGLGIIVAAAGLMRERPPRERGHSRASHRPGRSREGFFKVA
jgi:hypothetical protein